MKRNGDGLPPRYTFQNADMFYSLAIDLEWRHMKYDIGSQLTNKFMKQMTLERNTRMEQHLGTKIGRKVAILTMFECRKKGKVSIQCR